MGFNTEKRWSAVVLAALAAVAFALTGCNDTGTGDVPGTEQEPGGGY